jgi:Zn-dependent protease with chaperone function
MLAENLATAVAFAPMQAAAPVISPDHQFSDRDNRSARQAPMGVMVGTILSALLAGLTVGTLVALGSSRLALAVVTLVVVSCIASTRRLQHAGSVKALGVIALFLFSWALLFALSMEWLNRLMLRRVPALFGLGMMLVTAVAFMVLPIAIPAAIARRSRRRSGIATASDQSRPSSSVVMPDLTPLLLSVCLSTGFIVAGLLMMFALVLLVPRGAWQIVAILTLSLALPTVLRPLWILTYRCLLTTHWGTPEPPALRQGLETLRGLTGLEFDHVLCLHGSFGEGKPCFVLLGARQSTLVISAQVVQMLSAEQLLAVLAHEAAHVVLDHGNRMLAWGVPAAAMGIAFTIAGQMASRGLVPGSFRVVGFVAPIVVVQGVSPAL